MGLEIVIRWMPACDGAECSAVKSRASLEPNGLQHRVVYIMQGEPLQTHGLRSRLGFHIGPALLSENSGVVFVRAQQLVKIVEILLLPGEGQLVAQHMLAGEK